MLSSTRNIYNQIFAAPGHQILRATVTRQFDLVTEDILVAEDMLLIQPRKRNRANFEHSTMKQDYTSETQPREFYPIEKTGNSCSDQPTTRETCNSISKNEISALNLEQLEELKALVSDRIQIKKRYNNTPLRRIIARQVSTKAFTRDSLPESDTLSQTDTLVNTGSPELIKESLETIRARYNSTPLRRILSRQISTERQPDVSSNASTSTSYEPEPLEVRKARYNSTPLRRILSGQTSGERAKNAKQAITQSNSIASSSSPQSSTPTTVPRSNTPLRRILSRQSSAQTDLKNDKDEDQHYDRADSVISPDSPIRSRTRPLPTPHIPTVELNSESKIRAYEEALWKKSEVRTHQTEESVDVVVDVKELGIEAKKPKRIVVDSKGSPLRRILQRQTSRDWRAPARVAAV